MKEEEEQIGEEVEQSHADESRDVEEHLQHKIESLRLKQEKRAEEEIESDQRTEFESEDSSSGMCFPEWLDLEQPAEIERTRVEGEVVVVLKHHSNQHIRHDEGVEEHEEDHHGSGE